MKILVCGGAGYIGSHMIKLLSERGHDPVTLDNLTTGHRQAVRWGKLIEGDILDRDALHSVFRAVQFDAVMHFSARSLVGESVVDPSAYYHNNVIGSWTLLEAMREYGVRRFIFSSTAATFGVPEQNLIDESHPQHPINPYGWSKLMVEQILRDYAQAYVIASVSLRYFNAAGADPSGEIGESHQPETHLIPNVLRSLLKNGVPLRIFGTDYPTRDGTCVRDYIHVSDLCEAHLLALQFLDGQTGAHAFNLGNGEGFSILDVIRAAQNITARSIAYEVAPRRAGDPPMLVANSKKAREVLGWAPRLNRLEDIVSSAWRWHQQAHY